MQDGLIQGQIGHELLESTVLVLQLPQSPILGNCHLAVPLAPDVVGRLADPDGPCDLGNGRARIDLPQRGGNLFLRKLALLHAFLLPLEGCKLADFSSFCWPSFSGGPHTMNHLWVGR